jgi:hypothetical protein
MIRAPATDAGIELNCTQAWKSPVEFVHVHRSPRDPTAARALPMGAVLAKF